MWSSLSLFYVYDPLQLNRSNVRPDVLPDLVEHWTHKWHHLISHPRMSQVRSPFPRCGKQKGDPTYDEDYRCPMKDMADPQVASCIRVWPSASNPPPTTLLKHVTQGQLKASKAKQKKVEPSDQSPSSRLPTWQDSSTRSETTQSSIKEAYWRGEQTRSAQSPFSTSDTKQTHPLFFQSERGTMSPWVKPISSQMQTSKRHWFLKPVQGPLWCSERDNNKSFIEKRIYSSRRAQTQSPSFTSLFFRFKRVTTTHFRNKGSTLAVIDPQARPAQKVY